MTQELSELRQKIIEGQISEALDLIDEMDGMSKKALLDAIQTFLERMLTHLIKNDIEQRMTNSWAASIRDFLLQIYKRNLRDRQAWYLSGTDWAERLDEGYEVALADASGEALGGILTPFAISEKVNKAQVLAHAQAMLNILYVLPAKALPNAINEYLVRLPGGEMWAKK